MHAFLYDCWRAQYVATTTYVLSYCVLFLVQAHDVGDLTTSTAGDGEAALLLVLRPSNATINLRTFCSLLCVNKAVSASIADQYHGQFSVTCPKALCRKTAKGHSSQKWRRFTRWFAKYGHVVSSLSHYSACGSRERLAIAALFRRSALGLSEPAQAALGLQPSKRLVLREYSGPGSATILQQLPVQHLTRLHLSCPPQLQLLGMIG